MTMKHHIDGRGVMIEFGEKPPQEVRSVLKRNSFRWSPSAQAWWRRRVAGAADVLCAIDKILEPARPDGACWDCGGPDGWFRNRGAATPVLCEACSERRP